MTECAVSCRFHVSYCSHDTIFQPKYTRYQKAGKVKVLRCFPHCCPRHVYYRYCGTPITVHTEMPHPPKPAAAYVSLLHLAPSLEPEWAVNDVIEPVDVDRLTRDAGASWYVGRQKLEQQNVLTSVFNQDLAAGWTYGWASGRSQAVRDCQHHVKVYIFEVSSSAWRVVAKVLSPGFKIETYRNTTKATTETLSLSAPMVSTSHLLSHSSKNVIAPESPRHVSSRTQIMANHLGILLLFLQLTPIECTTSEWSSRLFQHISGRPPTRDDMSALLNTTSPVSDQLPSSPALQPLRALASSWLVHLFHPHNMGQYEAVVMAHRDCVCDKAELTAAYNDCVHLLYRISESFFKTDAATCTGDLAKTIAHHSPFLEDVLEGHLKREGYFKFHALVAHFREVALSATREPVRTPTDSAISGDWVVCVAKSHLAPQLAVSVTAAAHYATLLSACHVIHCEHELLVQSKWKLCPSSPSHFILDNHPRVLRTLPNGESSMASDGHTLDGDYVGTTSGGVVHLTCYRYNLAANEGLRVTFCLRVSEKRELVVRLQSQRVVLSAIDGSALYMTARDRTALWHSAQIEDVMHGELIYHDARAAPGVVEL
ncbi:hypothetical protein SPRG_14677 [Saprolegnia parasitica CBS 223.65]|uniref:Uncharacterized protein n=1 Tax=Saprolegnia parasitica (strain CBS 223.65) TaxID=695850 RepID=A0A067BSL9_SAPPC|nr:hypothetical protein SPRG_14677 [Saprolegnia parasitica CBS 223.65]KDO19815.1 hypothetical protein SPRG_14677 [Saprolegnia parasitica CBS 223.65]|eukprot:XP_012209474.1 hypothetical protein SPRG_14677 [Saprolegnia parasitica CBS 223.65]